MFLPYIFTKIEKHLDHIRVNIFLQDWWLIGLILTKKFLIQTITEFCQMLFKKYVIF